MFIHETGALYHWKNSVCSRDWHGRYWDPEDMESWRSYQTVEPLYHVHTRYLGWFRQTYTWLGGFVWSSNFKIENEQTWTTKPRRPPGIGGARWQLMDLIVVMKINEKILIVECSNDMNPINQWQRSGNTGLVRDRQRHQIKWGNLQVSYRAS